MKLITKKGEITISEKMIALIGGYAALNCFGVKGMTVRGFSDELVLLLKGENFHSPHQRRQRFVGAAHCRSIRDEYERHCKIHHERSQIRCRASDRHPGQQR